MNGQFGECCKDLKDAMTVDGKSLYRVEANGVLYQSIGYVQTPEGVGWYDMAVIFCPFCGTQLQEKDRIKSLS